MKPNELPMSDNRRLANCDAQRLRQMFSTWETRSHDKAFTAKYPTQEHYALAQLTDTTPAPDITGHAVRPRRTMAECYGILAETAAILRERAV
jgi:hypothetical protein